MLEELDREVLLIYLNNIRTLETIVYESCEKQEKLNERLARVQVFQLEPPNTPISIESVEYSVRDSKKRLIACIIGLLVFVFIWICMGMGNKSWNDSSLDSMFKGLFVFGVIICFPLGLFVSIYQFKEFKDSKSILEETKIENEKYNYELNRYELAKSEKLKKNEELIINIKMLNDELNTEILSTRNELDEAYKLNIIPLPFRNIEGIYYLFDYLSTSKETLSNALLHANIDSIKQKLKEVIKIQSDILLVQAQNNIIMYEQNQQIIDSMQNIEVYSKISAINSNVALKMQKKQLAYQKVEFFFKL